MTPLAHFLIAYVAAALLTKDIRLRRIAVIGGILPDLDGIFLLFDIGAYYRYHHALLHPPVAGVMLALALAAALAFYRKGAFKSAFAFFMLGFALHGAADVLGTNWPVNLLAPFGTLDVSVGALLPYGALALLNALVLLAVLALALALFAVQKRSALELLSVRADRKLTALFFRRHAHRI